MATYNKEKVKEATQMLIEAIGHPLDDPNIIETPERVAKMYDEILSGHCTSPDKYLKTFPSENRDMVVVRNVPFYSYCAHHLQPFYGKLTIAYLPNGKVLGLSKLVRIARIFAKRLQLQENLTQEIAQYLAEKLDCFGVAVSIRAQHHCMVIRGVRAYGAETVTTKYLGEFEKNSELRAEFRQHLSDTAGY